jgi:hypothetical protein
MNQILLLKDDAMRFKKVLLGAMVGGLAFFGWAGESRANSINVYLDSAPVTMGGTRDFTYRVQITPGNEVLPGNFFTIYDFQGLVGAPSSTDFTLANGWTFSSTGVGDAPPNYVGDFLSVDNPALPNITFTYSGLPIQNTDQFNDLVLGKFTATTSVLVGENPDENYVAQDVRISNTELSLGNTGSVTVPFNQNGPFLPLPATACGGLGLMGLLAVGRRRRPTVA